jgi:xylulokinase
MGALLLGIDIGTASSKAVLARPDGTVAASAEQSHRLSIPRPGWAEHDAEEVWWHDVRSLCDSLLSPDTRRQLAGICVSGIGPCVLPCDAQMRPLRPAILYGIDTRAGEEIAELNRRYGEGDILRRGGSALTSQAIGPKLLWLQRHEPATWKAATCWYMASSFVVARLTGEYVLDHHSASQCNPLYDLEAADWAHDWVHDLTGGLPLPRLVWPTEVVGTVTKQGADESGLPFGVPVMAGTIDAWAEAFSVGVRNPGDSMLMYGSTMFIIVNCDTLMLHPKLWATAGIEPATRCLAAGMATSGSVIEWIRELTGEPGIDVLIAEAARTPPGANGLLMLPYFAGERSPLFDPNARGVIAGLTLTHQRGHLARAAYEATAFGVRHIFETLAQAGATPQRTVAVGGGAKHPFWPQLVSDVTGLGQTLPQQTIGASYGDALMAAIGTGLVGPRTNWTIAQRSITPSEEAISDYDQLYDLYRQLHKGTLDVAHQLAALQVSGANDDEQRNAARKESR